MIQTEGYDPSVSITTTVAMKPGGKLHNVCKMQRTVALKGQIFRFTCPTCGHSKLKPYFAQMRKLRNEAILYESQGV